MVCLRFRSLLVVLVLLALLPWSGVLAQEAESGPGDTTPPVETAPPEPPPVPEAFQSPHATLRTFLRAMAGEAPDLDRAVECMDLSEVAVENGPLYANWLHKCLNRIERVDLERDPDIPDAAELRTPRYEDVASWTFFPRPTWSRPWVDPIRYGRIEELAAELDASIVLARQTDGSWRFSAATVAKIDALWEALRDLSVVAGVAADEYVTIAERIQSLWPKSLDEQRFLGVRAWQWLSLFILIVAGLVLDQLVRWTLSLVSIRIIRRRGGDARSETMRRTVRPFGLAVASILWLVAVHFLALPSDVLLYLVPAVRGFAIFSIVWALYRLTDLLGEVLVHQASLTDTKFDDLLVPLVRKAVKIFIAIFGVIYIANSFSIEIAPLLTGLGIGGVGFAFAAKDTLENFFGSVTVIVDRPFEVGDWVTIGDVEGTVEELGLRSVRIRTFYNSLVTIPTANLVRSAVDNYGRRKYRRWTTHLNLTYDTPPATIDAFCEGIRELIRLHPYTRKDYYQVWLHKFGAHSLDVLVYVFHEAPDWQTELRERHRLIADILRLAERLGVEFAFPTQTLHVQRPDDDAPSREPVTDASRLGRRAVRELTASADWRRRKPVPYVFQSTVDDDGDDETQIESKVGGDA